MEIVSRLYFEFQIVCKNTKIFVFKTLINKRKNVNVIIYSINTFFFNFEEISLKELTRVFLLSIFFMI